ncbi:MAG: methyltransferase type 11 [Rhodospirillaceae bacterium]|nr:methyltransferase type 11 [Rhodospirillaceae bacterium]
MSKSLDGYVKRLTTMTADENSQEVYEDWAPAYESSMVGEYGYIAPRISVDLFSSLVTDTNAKIIDLGCGTGLVGVELVKRGYRQIDGLDISENMLAEARSKGVYRDLIQANMTKPLGIPRSYEAAIGVGCFGNGHVGPDHFEDLIGTVATGGVVVFYMNGIPYEQDDYPRHFRALEERGVWRVVTLEQSNYMQTLDRPGWLLGAICGGVGNAD